MKGALIASPGMPKKEAPTGSHKVVWALVRWAPPARGSQSPRKAIPILPEVGILVTTAKIGMLHNAG